MKIAIIVLLAYFAMFLNVGIGGYSCLSEGGVYTQDFNSVLIKFDCIKE